MPFKLALSLLAILAIVVAVACSGPSTPSTPRPTYTPYPTFTPAPTAIPRPTYTPYPTFTPVPTPPSTIAIFESETVEYFLGRTQIALERAIEQFEAGEFQAAVASFKEAQRYHGKPSAVLENRIGLAYIFWQVYDLAIEHFSNAIAIRDNALDRVNRSTTYLEQSQCGMAITDAKAALTMEPETAPGFHTDVEANVVLANCHEYYGDYMAALQHLEAGIAIGEEHHYEEATLMNARAWRDELRLMIE